MRTKTRKRETSWGGRYGLIGALILVLALVVAGCVPGPTAQVQAQAPDDGDDVQRTLNVSGTGMVEAPTDRARITVGVQTEAETADDAMAENSEQMQAVVDALVEAGIDEADIQTQSVRLSPRYEEPPVPQEETGERELVGFTASNLVRVTLRDVEAVGEVLDAAIAAGANRVEGIQFEVSEPADLLADARDAAWADAEAKAEQLADLAGAELGDVLSINESSRGPVPIARGGLEADQALAVPVQPGSETLQVDLQVTWLLE